MIGLNVIKSNAPNTTLRECEKAIESYLHDKPQINVAVLDYMDSFNNGLGKEK